MQRSASLAPVGECGLCPVEWRSSLTVGGRTNVIETTPRPVLPAGVGFIKTSSTRPGKTAGYTAGMGSTVAFPKHVERWLALRTAARWEKKLAAALTAAGVPVFLPLLHRSTTSHGKRRVALLPVFPGYLFCSEGEFLGNPRVSPATRAKIAQVLRPPDPERLRVELGGIAELLTDRQLVQERLVGGVGDVVRVVGGPLAGNEGRVVRVKPNRWVVVVEVSFLGLRLEAEIDERLVERVV